MPLIKRDRKTHGPRPNGAQLFDTTNTPNRARTLIKITLSNRRIMDVANDCLDRFCSTIGYGIGGLIRHGWMNGVDHYEAFIDQMLNGAENMIDMEIEQCELLLANYPKLSLDRTQQVSKDYPVSSRGGMVFCRIIEKLDHLLNMQQALNNTGVISVQQCSALESEWASLPKLLFQKMMAVNNRITKQLRVNLQDKTPDKTKVPSVEQFIEVMRKQLEDNTGLIGDRFKASSAVGASTQHSQANPFPS